MNEFKLNRKLLSSYYIAAIFSFFIFQLLSSQIAGWARLFGLYLTSSTKNNFQSGAGLWIVFFFFCFFITFLIRRFIVEPLGFYINEEGAPWWELAILFFLVFGFYIFLLNKTFSFTMPREWFPPLLITLFGGASKDSVNSSSSALPWIWYLGPISFMYVRTKLTIKEGE